MCLTITIESPAKSSPSPPWDGLSKALAPGLAGCCVGADDEPELVGLLVANLQEQIRAEAC